MSIKQNDEYKYEELIRAITDDNDDNVKSIITENKNISIFDLNQQDKYGNIPLCLASQNGNINIVNFLIENGANINQKDKHGNTPLFYALRFKHFDLATRLLEVGANLTQPEETLIKGFWKERNDKKLKKYEDENFLKFTNMQENMAQGYKPKQPETIEDRQAVLEARAEAEQKSEYPAKIIPPVIGIILSGVALGLGLTLLAGGNQTKRRIVKKRNTKLRNTKLRNTNKTNKRRK